MDLFTWTDATSAPDMSNAPEPHSEPEMPTEAKAPGGGDKPPRRRRTSWNRRAQAAIDFTAALPPEQRPEALRERVTTAADIAVLDQLTGLNATVLKDIRSAFQLVAKATRLEPAQIGLAPAAMRPLLRSIEPAELGISAKRLSNVKSALRTAAKLTGHHAPDTVLYAALPAEAEALISQVEVESKRPVLRGFWRFLLRTGTAPEDAGVDHLAAYIAWVEESTYELDVKALRTTVRTSWNQAVTKIPGWPQHRMEPPPNPRQVSLPEATFLPSLIAAMHAYEASRLVDDLDGPAVRKISKSTAENRRKRLLFMASVLVRTGTKAEALPGLVELLTVDNLKLVLRWMHARSTMGSFTMNEVHMAIAVIDAGRTALGLSEEALQPLIDVKRRMRWAKKGLSQRARDRLQPFDSDRVRKRFFATPEKEFKIAKRLLEGDTKPDARQSPSPAPRQDHCPRPVRAAQHHERGLALRLLIEVPLRRRTLALIDVERHLLRDDRGRLFRLCIPGEHTKNGVAVDCPLSPDLTAIIERHLRLYRPNLHGSDKGTCLFPGKNGGPRCPDSLGNGIAKAVRRHVGAAFNISLMRHLVATMLYEESPQAGPVAQRLLGHTQLKTTEGMYGTRSTRSAHATWAAVLEKQRSGASGRTATSRTPSKPSKKKR
jgi:integrase